MGRATDPLRDAESYLFHGQAHEAAMMRTGRHRAMLARRAFHAKSKDLDATTAWRPTNRIGWTKNGYGFDSEGGCEMRYSAVVTQVEIGVGEQSRNLLQFELPEHAGVGIEGLNRFLIFHLNRA